MLEKRMVNGDNYLEAAVLWWNVEIVCTEAEKNNGIEQSRYFFDPLFPLFYSRSWISLLIACL